MTKLTDLIGRGQISIAAACEVASGVVDDHALPHGAVKAFFTLGTDGKYPANAERDLHRWLKKLYGLQLETYKITLELQIENQQVSKVPARVLLPHEFFHALAIMDSSLVFNSVILGNLENHDRENFWRHLQQLDPWRLHPFWAREDINLQRLFGVTVHGDGAVMKRDDECFVWSVSSCFSNEGIIKDPLMTKFPVAVVAERRMMSKRVLSLMRWRLICLLKMMCIPCFFFPVPP